MCLNLNGNSQCEKNTKWSTYSYLKEMPICCLFMTIIVYVQNLVFNLIYPALKSLQTYYNLQGQWIAMKKCSVSNFLQFFCPSLVSA